MHPYLPVLGPSRALALLGLLLTAFPGTSYAEDVEAFFSKDCKERTDTGDLLGLERALDSAKDKKEIVEDYRYSYYRAVALFSRGEINGGDLFSKEALDKMMASQQAKGYSNDDIKNVELRLKALREKMLARKRNQLNRVDSLRRLGVGTTDRPADDRLDRMNKVERERTYKEGRAD